MEKVKDDEIRLLENRIKKQLETFEKEIIEKDTKIKSTTAVLENVKYIAHKETVQLQMKNETFQMEKEEIVKKMKECESKNNLLAKKIIEVEEIVTELRCKKEELEKSVIKQMLKMKLRKPSRSRK